MLTFADQYKKLLYRCYYNPDYLVDPRGNPTKEIVNIMFDIDPMNNLFINKIRSSNLKYISAELCWYLTLDNTVEFISRYGRLWNSITNCDSTVNSNYGYQIFSGDNSGFNWAYESLLSDINSRQAVININKPEHSIKGVKDFPCTMYCAFSIRANKLNLSVHMRSNDMIFGIPNDIAFFTILQQQMLYLLKLKYHDLKIGKYTHIVDSLHIYKKDYSVVEKMLRENFESDSIPPVSSNLIDNKALHNIKAGVIDPSINSNQLTYWLNKNIK